mmetsp:Transcript_65509/g.95971  ORF Transcript_65509/g.95971 Transcript_65509/m.95971 type:complete len:84 (+) Transcript_65509:90-341(+)
MYIPPQTKQERKKEKKKDKQRTRQGGVNSGQPSEMQQMSVIRNAQETKCERERERARARAQARACMCEREIAQLLNASWPVRS